MKLNLLLTSFSLMFSMQVTAQVNISSSFFQLSVYEETTGKWVILSDNVEEQNFFEFNHSYTLLNQTNPRASINHLIHSSEVKESSGWREFKVVATTGKQYLVILDDKEEYLIFISEKDGEMYMLKYSIKESWIDGE